MKELQQVMKIMRLTLENSIKRLLLTFTLFFCFLHLVRHVACALTPDDTAEDSGSKQGIQDDEPSKTPNETSNNASTQNKVTLKKSMGAKGLKKSDYKKRCDANIAQKQATLTLLGLGLKPVQEKQKKSKKRKAEEANMKQAQCLAQSDRVSISIVSSGLWH